MDPVMVRPEDASRRSLALVLGCGPGALLDGRMDAACALVTRGAVDVLLVSGMPREMPTMIGRARACLPAERVLVDDGAARTLASFVRALRLFPSAVVGVPIYVVTQPYHLPRALRLARACGLDAAGVLAPCEPPATQLLRERLARVRAQVDVTLLRMGVHPLGCPRRQ